MGFKDTRKWMDKLESEGELKKIKAEVDWNREMGAIARKVSDKMGPALLFENIKDYKTTRCTKVSFGFLGTHSRIALMLGDGKSMDFRARKELLRRGKIWPTKI